MTTSKLLLLFVMFTYFIGGGDNPIVIVKKVKFWDKGAALEKLFKNFGMYQKDNEQKSASLQNLLNEIQEIGRKSILASRKPITIENGSS